jgi:hypothetical protein
LALGLCCFAALPLAAIGLLNLWQAAKGSQPELGLQEWLLAVVVIFSSYFAAATLAAPAFWLTRPLRPRLLGYLITGVLLTPIVYGSVAYAGYLAWEPTGRIVFGRPGETQQEFLASLPLVVVFCACVGLPGGFLVWLKARKRAV